MFVLLTDYIFIADLIFPVTGLENYFRKKEQRRNLILSQIYPKALDIE
jgi:hypothetical protein